MVSIDCQFNKATPITPSDATDLPQVTEAVWVGGAGVVAAVMPDQSVVNFTCIAGTVLPLKVRRINATNTTATLLIALYQN
jgi:hypothetical protein